MASIRRIVEHVICLGKLSRKPNENLPADLREYRITSKRVQVPGGSLPGRPPGAPHLEQQLSQRVDRTRMRPVEHTHWDSKAFGVRVHCRGNHDGNVGNWVLSCHFVRGFSDCPYTELVTARIWLSGSAGPGGNHEGHTGAID